MSILVCLVLGVVGCQSNAPVQTGAVPSSMRDVTAVRLNFRYEADVPPPDLMVSAGPDAERNSAVQADFDQNRPQALLDMTFSSPDKKRVLAVYHKPTDIQSEYRLDMYSSEGKALGNTTSESMAVHFPDSITWSPDSTTVAFVAMARVIQGTSDAGIQSAPPAPASETQSDPEVVANTDPIGNTAAVDGETNAAEAQGKALTEIPAPILTFRTEQLYTANSDGGALKVITQNEGLIYFYYVWSPDSSMLAALASTAREWQFLQYQADSKGEAFIPQGRLRLLEKTGRERRLDDTLTTVRPVWSPDSAKVASGYDTQIRIFDAIRDNPTQAAIPLRNHLLLSSQVFDREQASKLEVDANVISKANSSTNTNNEPSSSPAANTSFPASTLPDAANLVSFNPVVTLEWTADDMLYFRTAFVQRMKNEADSVTSFARWHRLILTPQALVLEN